MTSWSQPIQKQVPTASFYNWLAGYFLHEKCILHNSIQRTDDYDFRKLTWQPVGLFRDCIRTFVFYIYSGTTWFQEVVWLVMNNADTDTAIAINQDLRVPFLEIDKGKVITSFWIWTPGSVCPQVFPWQTNISFHIIGLHCFISTVCDLHNFM